MSLRTTAALTTGLLATIVAFALPLSGQAQTSDAPRLQWNEPPAMTIDETGEYLATLSTTFGDLEVTLFTAEAPVTVNNFVFLARAGYYDNVIFHRVIRGFMVQTGDPLGTGTGGPGYRFTDEPVARDYTRGIVAMANAGPNTNGSQFFIVHGEEVRLPPNYTIFGEVSSGFDVLDRIAAVPVTASSRGENSVPQERVAIVSIAVVER